jgi:hypothetical protein
LLRFWSVESDKNWKLWHTSKKRASICYKKHSTFEIWVLRDKLTKSFSLNNISTRLRSTSLFNFLSCFSRFIFDIEISSNNENRCCSRLRIVWLWNLGFMIPSSSLKYSHSFIDLVWIKFTSTKSSIDDSFKIFKLNNFQIVTSLTSLFLFSLWEQCSRCCCFVMNWSSQWIQEFECLILCWIHF